MKRAMLIVLMAALLGLNMACELSWDEDDDGGAAAEPAQLADPVTMQFEAPCTIAEIDAGDAVLTCQAAEFSAATELVLQDGDIVRVRFVFTSTDPAQLAWELKSIEIIGLWF